jgi:LmbE family N-acetylglucosaminyl deacetylase
MWGGFRDGDLPFDRSAIVQLESLLATLTPRLVVTHFPNDTHQDHDRLARVAMAAARRHANVLFFEGPSSLGFQPTMYHVLDKRSYQRKLDAVAAHSSQLGRTGLYEFVDATARRRGYDSRSGALAEGFVPYRSSVFLGE